MCIRDRYRTDKSPSGKICPNLLVSEEKMSWEKEKQNFYVASEIVRMQPVIDGEETYLRFLNGNSWIQNFFPNFVFGEMPRRREEWKVPKILDFVEACFFLFQKALMSRKITTEKVKKDFIHFNRYDKTNEILGKYEVKI